MGISFGHLSRKMLIPLSIPVLYLIRHNLLDKFDIILKNKHQSVFIHTFITSISYSFNGILFIIEKRSLKTDKTLDQEDIEFNNQLLIEKEKMEKKQKKLKKLYLILLPLFQFFNLLSYDIFYIFKPSDYNKYYYYALSIPIFFIITALMSYQFLNIHIHRHQIITMIISFLLGFILVFSCIIILENNSISSLYNFLFLVECIGIRSLRFVLVVFGKLFMTKTYVTPVQLMTFFGIFGILFSLIVNALSFFINLNFIKDPKLNDYFHIDNETGFKRLLTIFDSWGNFSESIFYCIGTIIFFFFEKYMCWFCIYTFTPNHFTMYSSIDSLIAIFYESFSNLFFKEQNYQNVLIFVISSIVLIIIFFCGLVFNELLILRFCDLDKYTNVEINKRQKNETKISLITDTIIDNNNRNLSVGSVNE